MKAIIRISQNQKNKNEEIKDSFIFEDVRKITEIDGDHLLHGKFKNKGDFSYKIKDVFGYFIHKDDNRSIDLVISKAFIKNLIPQIEKELNNYTFELDISEDYVYEEKEEGFLLIKKSDYPEELLKSTFVK